MNGRAVLALGVLLAMVPLAATMASSDAETLTINLYCGLKSLIEGQVGLLVGLVFVSTGLFSLIRGGKWVPALILIGTGALISAVPALINSFFTGYGTMLEKAGISSAATDSFAQIGASCGTSSASSGSEAGGVEALSSTATSSSGSNADNTIVQPDPALSGVCTYCNN